MKGAGAAHVETIAIAAAIQAAALGAAAATRDWWPLLPLQVAAGFVMARTGGGRWMSVAVGVFLAGMPVLAIAFNQRPEQALWDQLALAALLVWPGYLVGAGTRNEEFGNAAKTVAGLVILGAELLLIVWLFTHPIQVGY